ncbi:hypothetical protein CDAR_372561 [Caerostris darwini]|uniref:Uncharacterized protein n=1 Tax=Caerostris darwini TaxID=1538125 RepID=A0AAV4T9U1_9ARAC|nr:hypothetical protein CDAR_372561 [Caerostris darwini]
MEVSLSRIRNSRISSGVRGNVCRVEKSTDYWCRQRDQCTGNASGIPPGETGQPNITLDSGSYILYQLTASSETGKTGKYIQEYKNLSKGDGCLKNKLELLKITLKSFNPLLEIF